MARLVTSCQ